MFYLVVVYASRFRNYIFAGRNRIRVARKKWGDPKAAGDLAAESLCRAEGYGSKWRTVSFPAAQALLASCSEARMFTIRDVRMVRNAGCLAR